MKKLEIIKVDKYTYTLQDKNNNNYELIIDFQNIEEQPQSGNYIYIDETILESKNFYTFGKLNSEYGRKIENENDKYLIILETNNKKYYLKRLYG